MQMMSGSHNQLPANKSPPTPMIQTPVINPNNAVPPVFPGTSGTTNSSPISQAAAPSEDSPKTTPIKTAVTATAAESTGDASVGHNHNRTVSTTSSVASSVPELVAINNSAINNSSGDTKANSLT